MTAAIIKPTYMRVLIKIPFLLLIISLVVISCKKEGPAGPTGNANVTVFNFGSRTINGTSEYQLPGISGAQLDSSIVLAYINPNTYSETVWFPVPGSAGGGVEMSFIIYPVTNGCAFSLRLFKAADGIPYASPIVFRKTRIFIVPANKMVNVNGRIAGPDLKDYYAVKEFYKIPD
jgi:hypothetical protein